MAILDGKTTGLTFAGSMSRKLLDAYGGAFYTLSGGSNVDTLNGQSGATVATFKAAATNFPQLATAGPETLEAIQMLGDDFMSGRDSGGTAIAMSNLISASANYWIISFIVNSYDTNSANSYDNQALWIDNGEFAGCTMKSVPTILNYNWDGSDDHADVGGEATGTVMTIEGRHESGNIYIRKNAGSWSSPTASGDTTTLTNPVFLGGRTLAKDFIGYIFEVVFYSAVPSSGDMDAIAADFYAWVSGVTPPAAASNKFLPLMGVGS